MRAVRRSDRVTRHQVKNGQFHPSGTMRHRLQEIQIPSVPQVGRLNIVERRMSRFLREPPSVRTAAGVIVTATTVVVVAGGVLMWLLDHSEYSDIWVGMWWALQTVTTVGYGDVTPRNPSGRIIAAFVMLQGIAFLAITTAAITSTFVARASKEREAAHAAVEDEAEVRIEAKLEGIDQRLDRLEKLLQVREPGVG
jgi:voltage-gated potassium channel